MCVHFSNMSLNTDYKFKIIILGEPGVGKTSMIHTYTNTTSPSNNHSVHLTSKELVINEKQVQLQIWETSSQTFFKHVAPNYYDGVLLVYDVTDRKTFHALSDWLTLLREKCAGAVTLVVKNKTGDIDSAAVSRDEARRFMRDEVLECVECCAENKDNVIKIFEHLTLRIFQAKNVFPAEEINRDSSASFLLPVHDPVDEHELVSEKIRQPDTPFTLPVQSPINECERLTEQPGSINSSGDIHVQTAQQQTNLGANGHLNTSPPPSAVLESDDELELSFVWVSFLPPIVKLPPEITPLRVGRRRTSADSVLSLMTESEQSAFRLAEEGRSNETLQQRHR